MRAVSAITAASNGGPDAGISSDDTRGAIQPIISTGMATLSRTDVASHYQRSDNSSEKRGESDDGRTRTDGVAGARPRTRRGDGDAGAAHAERGVSHGR